MKEEYRYQSFTSKAFQTERLQASWRAKVAESVQYDINTAISAGEITRLSFAIIGL